MNTLKSTTKPLTWFTALLLLAAAAGCGSDGGRDSIFGNAIDGAGVGGNPGPAGAAPDLGRAGTFGGFGGNAGMTNQGIFTSITGAQSQPVSIGSTAAGTLITGFHDTSDVACTYTETGSNIGVVNGTINTSAPQPGACPPGSNPSKAEIAAAAALAALTAYNDLVARPAGSDPGNGQLAGLTLAPGTYTSASGSFLLTGSDLTLDAQGNPNAIWIFQIASSLTVGDTAPRSVILAGGAQPKNVFWQVGSSATINGAGGGTMVGTIISSASTTFSTAGNVALTTLNGRALALNASVTMVNTVINVPTP